jgi:hypothetical protein
MQTVIQTAGISRAYGQVVIPQQINNPLRAVGKENVSYEFKTVAEYHASILQHLAELKTIATESNTTTCQEEFIGISMQAISMYSLLFTDTVSRIAASGLRNYANMILAGASLFLGGDPEGRFFQLTVEIGDRSLRNSPALSKLISANRRKEDHGIYISSISEILKELQLFCSDHPLYQNIIVQLIKKG